jgi:hypothetical protein
VAVGEAADVAAGADEVTDMGGVEGGLKGGIADDLESRESYLAMNTFQMCHITWHCIRHCRCLCPT